MDEKKLKPEGDEEVQEGRHRVETREVRRLLEAPRSGSLAWRSVTPTRFVASLKNGTRYTAYLDEGQGWTAAELHDGRPRLIARGVASLGEAQRAVDVRHQRVQPVRAARQQVVFHEPTDQFVEPVIARRAQESMSVHNFGVGKGIDAEDLERFTWWLREYHYGYVPTEADLLGEATWQQLFQKYAGEVGPDFRAKYAGVLAARRVAWVQAAAHRLLVNSKDMYTRETLTPAQRHIMKQARLDPQGVLIGRRAEDWETTGATMSDDDLDALVAMGYLGREYSNTYGVMMYHLTHAGEYGLPVESRREATIQPVRASEQEWIDAFLVAFQERTGRAFHDAAPLEDVSKYINTGYTPEGAAYEVATKTGLLASGRRTYEKRVPSRAEGSRWHQHEVAVDTVINPFKGFLGGPTAEEAEEILRVEFQYTDAEIQRLKAARLTESWQDAVDAAKQNQPLGEFSVAELRQASDWLEDKIRMLSGEAERMDAPNIGSNYQRKIDELVQANNAVVLAMTTRESHRTREAGDSPITLGEYTGGMSPETGISLDERDEFERWIKARNLEGEVLDRLQWALLFDEYRHEMLYSAQRTREALTTTSQELWNLMVAQADPWADLIFTEYTVDDWKQFVHGFRGQIPFEKMPQDVGTASADEIAQALYEYAQNLKQTAGTTEESKQQDAVAPTPVETQRLFNVPLKSEVLLAAAVAAADELLAELDGPFVVLQEQEIVGGKDRAVPTVTVQSQTGEVFRLSLQEGCLHVDDVHETRGYTAVKKDGTVLETLPAQSMTAARQEVGRALRDERRDEYYDWESDGSRVVPASEPTLEEAFSWAGEITDLAVEEREGGVGIVGDEMVDALNDLAESLLEEAD